MGCGGPPQHKGFGRVAPCVGGLIGVTKAGVVLEEELTGSVCKKSDVT